VNVDDHRLIDACLKGNQGAFDVLMRRYEERVFNLVYRVLGNVEDAQDVVQETFINAYQSLPNFKRESLFYTWLYRIAMNTAISHKRRHKGTVSFDAGRNGEGGLEPLDNSEYNRPGHAMEKAELERRIQKALNSLSPEHKIVLVFKEMEGLKYEEIADILQLPIGTVRSRLHRARIELRDLLQREGGV
jgi:RNA polymerase sigma-70 factor, ECF subfamily